MNENKSTKEKSCLLIIIIIIVILKKNLKYNILSLILFNLVFALNDRG